MPLSNPYTSQLQGFTAGVPNAKRALADIYKLRIKQRQGLSNEMRALYGTEYNALGTQLRNAGLAYGEAQAGGERLLAESGYSRGGELQGNEAGFLTGLVKGGVDPFRQFTTSTLGAQRQAVKGYKAADIGELRTLVTGLGKERSAAQAELEQGIVDTQTNLQTEATAFAQQQAYNQQLRTFYDSSIANFSASTAWGPGGGGGIVAAAQRYLGVPYKWGGTSTQGFDCSGLTRQVYADQGITIPRTSREQYAASSKVPGGLRNAAVGDLLFWGNPVHHVALYIGNGMMIAAPHAGAVVRVQPVYGSPMVGRFG